MKKIILFLTIFNLQFSIISLTKAQAPSAIPYQAIARDNVGNPIANHVVSVRFRILDEILNGNILYEESQSILTNTFGLFTVNIGQGTIIRGTFAGIMWGEGPRFLQVELDVNGGAIFSDMGTQQLLSVPYALSAGNGNWEKSPTNIYNSNFGNVGIGTAVAITAKLVISGNAGAEGIDLSSTDQYANLRVIRNSLGGDNDLYLGYGSGILSALHLYSNNAETVTIKDGNMGVGTTTPVASAKLDVTSTNQGFLPPRMTLLLRDAISNPVAGLVLWCTDCGSNGQLEVYDGVSWTDMSGAPTALPFKVITTPITNITSQGFQSGGNILSNGGFPVTARGVCWNTAGLPTVALLTRTINGSGSGIFSSSYSGLNPSTTYYLRAYATNSMGTSYGNQISFTTLNAVPPTVNTLLMYVNSQSAESGGAVILSGGNNVTAFGVCWSTSHNPTILLSTKTNDGFGVETFPSNITGLTPSTTYYVRAYATNSVGTSYGNEIGFFTAPVPLGANFQGGILAYVLKPGDPNYVPGESHGFIAAPTNQNGFFQWGCIGVEIAGANDSALGTGSQNTMDIMFGCGAPGTAAYVCSNLILNGHSDWYLPSRDELYTLYHNLKIAGLGNFDDELYWSSTQIEDIHYIPFILAMVVSFNSGIEGANFKDDQTERVRAIRSF